MVKVFGDDLSLLDQKAREVASLISKISGATEVQVDNPPLVPEVGIKLKATQLAQMGFAPGVVLDGIQTAYQGVRVSQIYDRNRVYDVNVILDPSLRGDPTQIGQLGLRNPEGLWAPIRQLAEIEPRHGRYVIQHENVSRSRL